MLRLLATPLIVAALMPCVATAADASRTAAVADFSSCAKPEWPKESLRLEQRGRVTLAFLIGADGTVNDAKVVNSSGYPLLDEAAREGIRKCRFKPASVAADGWPEVASEEVTGTKFGASTAGHWAATQPDASKAIVPTATR